MTEDRRPPGRIITFYSYKGGTGRSMAVANIAWILASNGRRVLVIDWDFEAPGLHRYFHPFLEDKDLESSPGLIDYFVDFVTAARQRPLAPESETTWYQSFTDLVGYSRSLDWDFGAGYLDFVPAGRQGPAYGVRVGQLDWEEFYTSLGGGVLLEALKLRLREDYDYVLIDSRTGISDTAGICTVQMPDDLVVAFTFNRQSTLGAAAIARSVLQQRRKPNGEPAVRVWPVPMRVELFEKDRLERARDLARQAFAPFLRRLPRSERELYWGSIEVLYQPYFAYEEVLAPFAERRRQTSTLLASMEQIARRISDVTEVGEMSESDRRRGLALFVPPRLEVSNVSAVPRVFMSYSRGDREHAFQLWKHVTARFGTQNVFLDQTSIGLGVDWQEATAAAIRDADVALAVIGPEFEELGPSEKLAQELSAIRSQDKRIIPVFVGGAGMPIEPPIETQTSDFSWLARLTNVSVDTEKPDQGLATLLDGIAQVVAAVPVPAAPLDPDDPEKGRWGGSPSANGRILSASVTAITDRWFRIELTVAGSGSPLTAPVTFYLRPTFADPVQQVQPENGIARVELQAYGAFTVGAQTDGGKTYLELDLTSLFPAPPGFVGH